MASSKGFLVLLIFLILSITLLFGCTDTSNYTWDNDTFQYVKNDSANNSDSKDSNFQSTPQISIDSNFDSNALLIASWNLQIFGPSKASSPTLLNYYAEKISEYDIIVIQEIRDSAQEAFPKLCALLPEYDCIVSSRAGRSSSKEQYGIIFKGVELVSTKDYSPVEQVFFERPPFEATFKKNGWVFTLITIHTKPDDVNNELTLVEEKLKPREDEEIILLGDLNADCDYYDANAETQFDSSFVWAIPDDVDTTVSKTNCAYDRIIFSNSVQDNFLGYGIMSDVNLEHSDHYLVFGAFSTN